MQVINIDDCTFWYTTSYESNSITYRLDLCTELFQQKDLIYGAWMIFGDLDIVRYVSEKESAHDP